MVVGAIGTHTDVVVIGAGPGGYAAALRAADAGLEVTLVERGHLGGTCLNVGCVPSKALIHIADSIHRARTTPGVRGNTEADWAEVRGHLAALTSRLRTGVESLLSAAGVTVIKGTANFARHDRLAIEQPVTPGHESPVVHLEFDHAIVATGSRPMVLPSLPLGGRVVDSTGALALGHQPERVAVVGGGYIGVELGTAFAKLGSSVTIVEATGDLLPATPAPLRRVVMRRLKDLGVEVRVNTTAVAHSGESLQLGDGSAVASDVVVVAVGRRPNSDRCSIDAAGVNLTDRGHVVVDPELRAAPGIFAIGDLIEGPALAHRATSDAERVVATISGEPALAPTVVPAVIYGDPEVMSVGVAPAEARAMGATVHRFPHAASARALTASEPDGLTLVVADSAGTVIGVHVAGPHASELAGEATLAIEMAATLEDLAATIHAHPTMSESLAEAAWLGLGHPLHIRS